MSSDPSPLTLAAAQAAVDRWIRTVGVRYFSELSNLAQLTEEVGELARVLNRRYGDQSAKLGDPAASEERLAEEMADVLFVLIALANQTGVDLTAAFQASLEKKSRRDGTRHRDNPKLTGRPEAEPPTSRTEPDSVRGGAEGGNPLASTPPPGCPPGEWPPPF